MNPSINLPLVPISYLRIKIPESKWIAGTRDSISEKNVTITPFFIYVFLWPNNFTELALWNSWIRIAIFVDGRFLDLDLQILSQTLGESQSYLSNLSTIWIPESGAEFSYIKEAFGPLPAFLFVWVNVFLQVCKKTINPFKACKTRPYFPQDVASRSAVAMTFGTYICEIFWPCVDPSGNKALAVQFTAMTATVLLTSINCYRVKKLVKIVEMFSIIKLTSVIILIISGIFYLSYYSIPIDVNWLENSSTSPGSYAHAFYSVIKIKFQFFDYFCNIFF